MIPRRPARRVQIDASRRQHIRPALPCAAATASLRHGFQMVQAGGYRTIGKG
jgi:hypothetical protein